MKKREVEVQKKHTERLQVAVDEANESKSKMENNHEEFEKFVNKSMDILDAYETELKEKILDFSSSQHESYMNNVSRRMQKVEVISGFMTFLPKDFSLLFITYPPHDVSPQDKSPEEDISFK